MFGRADRNDQKSRPASAAVHRVIVASSIWTAEIEEQIRINPPSSFSNPDGGGGVIALKSFEKIPPGDKSSTTRGERERITAEERSESKRWTAKAREPTAAFDSNMSSGRHIRPFIQNEISILCV